MVTRLRWRVQERSRFVNRSAIQPFDERIRCYTSAWIRAKEIVFSIDGRLDTHTPTVIVVPGIANLLVIVVDKRLAKTDWRVPLQFGLVDCLF